MTPERFYGVAEEAYCKRELQIFSQTLEPEAKEKARIAVLDKRKEFKTLYPKFWQLLQNLDLYKDTE